MPIQDRRKTNEARVAELITKLHQELRSPTDKGPLIDVSSAGPVKKFRVVVIWPEWGSMEVVDRTHVIFTAFEQAKLAQYPVADLSLAFGYTPDEANRLGLYSDFGDVA
jgi:hypothetical protein